MVNLCTKEHVKQLGRSYTHGTDVFVASVQTLISRKDKLRNMLSRVKCWFIDECHHCLPENTWGKAIALFPNAQGIGVTATPLRSDGKALDSIFDNLIVGPPMSVLIERGYLSPYRVFCPPVSFDVNALRIGASGEFIRAELADAAHESSIVGDVVQQYLRIAAGKRGLTFAVDLQSASDIVDAFNAAGVPAIYVDAQTKDQDRFDALEKLASGEVLQVVNVGLFGEGTDCPAVEVICMARPTASYGLFCQMFGRGLRPLSVGEASQGSGESAADGRCFRGHHHRLRRG